MATFTKYSSPEGDFYVNDETNESFQSYVNDDRYKAFKAELDAGVHTAVDYIEDTAAQEEMLAHVQIVAEENASLRALIPLVIQLAETAGISTDDLTKLKERSAKIETQAAKVRGKSGN